MNEIESERDSRFETPMRLIAFFFAALASLLAGCAPEFPQSVGPWDVDDLPAGRKGPRVPDPPSFVQARANAATLGDGLKVELIGLTREFMGPRELDLSLMDRSWTPSGAPYRGEELARTGSAHFFEPTVKSGVRYLSFRITAPANMDADFTGFVPGTALLGDDPPENHGREIPIRVQLSGSFPNYYRAAIAVEGRRNDRYFMARPGVPGARSSRSAARRR